MQAGVSPVGPAAPADGADDPSAALPRVDIDSLELVRPRSVSIEHVALWAMRQLRPPALLEELGLSGAQRAAWHWLRQRSALGELLGCDCETMGQNALHRASDRLLRHRDTIETRLFQRAADLFDLQPTVTLHGRTSTCCEGAAGQQPLARRGHSREKRHDCPPLTLGLVLEGSRATHPGVHGLRTNSVGWDAERLWRTCVTRTDLEAVFRSLGSELGLRPIHHRKPARSAGRLCLSVRACQLVPVVRQRLRAGRRPAGRRCAVAWRVGSGWQQAIHERLGVDASPRGVRKLVVQPRRRREHARNAVPHA